MKYIHTFGPSSPLETCHDIVNWDWITHVVLLCYEIISSGWFKSIWKSNCWVCRKPPSNSRNQNVHRGRGYWMILYTCLWVASRMCPSWMFLSVSFHVDHVKFWILEVFLALGMFGREFGSILPGVISSITNPNNSYTLLFARETAENSYIPLVAPWVIESTWINLTTFKSLEFLKFTENNLFKNGETECRDLETHSLPLWDWANASASVVQVLVLF